MQKLVNIYSELGKRVNSLGFNGFSEYVYNPLIYAKNMHEQYLKKYAKKKVALLVGMNPGPFGMAQTGVPFGDVVMVRDFLKIQGKVGHPFNEHPKRKIDGFECKRREISGKRLWGFAESKFGSAADFFSKFFVVNYCPLIFLSPTGSNLTPDKLKASLQKELFEICDDALKKVVLELNSPLVIGIGLFAKKACQRATQGMDVKIAQILHPSPASPLANSGWDQRVEKQLIDLGMNF